MLLTVDGLVTRSYPVGDHDRLVHVVTAEHGRLPVMVKGGQSKNSPNVACTQLFTWGNYELYHKGEMYWLRSGSVLNAFYELSCDIADVALAAYLCDLTSELTGEGVEAGELLRTLLNSLYMLGQHTRSRALVKGVFEWRAAALSGYCPDLAGCASCGETFPASCYLDVMDGSVRCTDCQGRLNRIRTVGGTPADESEKRTILCHLSGSALAAVRYVVSVPGQKIFSFALKDEAEEADFGRAAETFVLNQLERGFDTLNFYKTVEV